MVNILHHHQVISEWYLGVFLMKCHLPVHSNFVWSFASSKIWVKTFHCLVTTYDSPYSSAFVKKSLDEYEMNDPYGGKVLLIDMKCLQQVVSLSTFTINLCTLTVIADWFLSCVLQFPHSLSFASHQQWLCACAVETFQGKEQLKWNDK